MRDESFKDSTQHLGEVRPRRFGVLVESARRDDVPITGCDVGGAFVARHPITGRPVILGAAGRDDEIVAAVSPSGAGIGAKIADTDHFAVDHRRRDRVDRMVVRFRINGVFVGVGSSVVVLVIVERPSTGATEVQFGDGGVVHAPMSSTHGTACQHR